jgi:serine/threonine protein kinase
VLLNKFERNPSENFLNANIRLEWSIELFDALAFMHERKVAHCDLKPKNVFLFRNKRKEDRISLKIGDFGMSKEKSMSDFKIYVGTWHYQSPEVMRMQPFSFETDVW